MDARKLYLIDANVLISAQRFYYPRERIPHYWDWLLKKAREDKIKMPWLIYNEIQGSGSLPEWLKGKEVVENLILQHNTPQSDVDKVIDEHYASDLSKSEMELIGYDPYLIAAAYSLNKPIFAAIQECTIVTKEKSSPTKIRHNRKIPDICKELNIRCIDDFTMCSELEFKIEQA